ncbi:MAG TPA: hypothetical protein VM282_12370 [Acidimicrobiales bacterium]|nr:hypothetical protein [Acidimicrobiales bacterium]
MKTGSPQPTRVPAVIGGLLLAVGWGLVAAVVFVQLTVLSPGTYRDALVRADAYERVYTEVLADPEFASLKERLAGSLVPTAGNEVQVRVLSVSALRWSLPPSRLRSGTEAFVVQVLAYVRGDVPRLDGSAPVADIVDRVDGTTAAEVRALLADAAELVAEGATSYEAEVAAFVAELAAGRVPSTVPIYGGSEFDVDRALAVVVGVGEVTDPRIRDQVEAALLAGDQRDALIVASTRAVAVHAAGVSEQLRAGTVGGGDVDVIAELADRAGLDPSAVVAELDMARAAARWLSWPTAVVGVAMMVIGAGMVIRRGWRRWVMSFGAALIFGGLLVGLVWVLIASAAGSPLAPATGEGPGTWGLPGGLRRVLGDVEGEIGAAFARRAAMLAVGPIAVGAGLVAGAAAWSWLRVPVRAKGLIAATSVVVVAVPAVWMTARAAGVGSPRACNGFVELCDRRYDEVVYAATHNSMSSPDVVHVWPEQDHDIGEQLDQGIRALLIDTHYWTPMLSQAQLAEAEPFFTPELASTVFARLGPLREQRPGTFLCHAHCALGATPLVDALREVRAFLNDNPHDVVTLIIQDAISPTDTVAAFESADLLRYVHTHDPTRPWRTLGDLIDGDERLVVFAEADGGDPAWYHAAFEHIQETPFLFRLPEAFSCDPNRGDPAAGLFLMNHWVQRIAPDRADAALVNQRQFVVGRARECARTRGRTPNFIAVNFSNIGDIVGAVEELNLPR